MRTSIYVDTETRQRLKRVKPPDMAIVNFINVLLSMWEQATNEQRGRALQSKKEN